MFRLFVTTGTSKLFLMGGEAQFNNFFFFSNLGPDTAYCKRITLNFFYSEIKSDLFCAKIRILLGKNSVDFYLELLFVVTCAT